MAGTLRFVAAIGLLGPTSGCELVFGIDEKTLSPGGTGGNASGTGGGGGTGTGGSTCARKELFPDSTPFCSDGQIEVPCNDPAAIPGQDGLHVGRPPEYSTDGSNPDWVRDVVTGLWWARGTQTVVSALDTVDCGISPGAKPQVPPLVDLLTLVDFGFPTAPSADPSYFTSPKEFITGEVGSAGEPLTIAFTNGQVSYSFTGVYELRCEGGSLYGEIDPDLRTFDESGDGAWTLDPLTGLTWQLPFEEATRWSEAAAVCQSLPAPADGCGPWRLPSVKELLTVVAVQGRMHPAFFDTGQVDPQDARYWSSSFVAASPSYVWTVQYGDPVTGNSQAPYASATQDTYVRCVR